MRLTACPACGQSISRTAQACPRCGHRPAGLIPRNLAGPVFLLFLLLIGFMFLPSSH